MPCINIDLDYFAHRKVLRLCAKLGQWAEIIPLKLWAYTGKFHPEDGRLIGYSPVELMVLLGIKYPDGFNAPSNAPGNAPGIAYSNAMVVLQALLDCGFCIATKGGWAVHEWLEYQGHIKALSERARHASNKRWAKLNPNKQINAPGIPQAMPQNDSSNPLTLKIFKSSDQNHKSKTSELEKNIPAHRDSIPTSREDFSLNSTRNNHTNLSVTQFPEEPYFPKVTNEFELHEPNGKNPAEFDQFDQFSENSPETPPSHHVEPDPILPLPQVLNEHLDAFPAVSGGSEFDSQVQLPPEVKNREEAGQKTEAVPIAPIQEQKKIKADKLWPTDSYEYETAHAFATEYLPGWAPSAKPASDAIIQKWATEVDLMQRIDGRSWEDVNNLLNLIEKEKPSRTGFEWKKVILSMGTLRQRWNEGKLEDLINNNKKKTGGW